MDKISNKLNIIKDAKDDIKMALENKGVTVGDVGIGEYADKINGIESVSDYYISSLSSGKTIIEAIKKIPVIQVTGSMKNFANGCSKLESVSMLDTSKVTSMENAFSGCSSLKTIPLFNTSIVTTMRSMFNGCDVLESVPLFDTSKVSNMSYMFSGCDKLKSVPQLNTSNVTNFERMFQSCYELESVPLLDTNKATSSMGGMFYQCQKLETITSLNTSNITGLYGTFDGCIALKTLPMFNTPKVIDIRTTFQNCSSLTDFEGLQDLGMGYTTTYSANYSNYTLDLSTCTALTEQSLINVLNGLYDIATKGCNTQKCTLGAKNIAKLTSEAGQQALSNATAKGWTIS